MSFYRIYRPQTIEEIDNGSAAIKLTELTHKKREDLPHAYLFAGPRGAGKTTAARIIAKLFNCVKRKEGEGPCGTCEQCTSIAAGTNMDVIEIDAASNRGIDEMRTLRERIGYAPTKAAYTVYIIDEVHMLTTEAFNALLKTLEEPPVHAIFILATTELSKVIPTIRSRCMMIPFTQASIKELEHALQRIVTKEHITIDKEALAAICASADGSFRDAVKYLEQVSLSGKAITVDAVRSALSLSDTSKLDAFFSALSAEKAEDAIAVCSDIAAAGGDMRAFVTEVLRTIETMLHAHAVHRPLPEHSLSKEQCLKAGTLFTAAWNDMKISPVPMLPVEIAIVSFTENRPADTHPVHAEQRKEKQGEVVVQTKRDGKPEKQQVEDPPTDNDPTPIPGLISYEKLTDCWKDVIEAFKPYNHSIAGVLRSTRPKSVENGIVTIEAFYQFHKDKLSEPKTKEIMVTVLKKLFGEKIKVDIVLGKK